MSDTRGSEDDQIYRREAIELYEAMLCNGARDVALDISDSTRLATLMKLLGGKAAYLASNLQELGGFSEDDAKLSAWRDVWAQLGRVMRAAPDDPTYEVATVIDRASSRVMPSEFDSSGKPQNIALAQFYRNFANNIDTPSISPDAAWLHD
jgi:hypothetical protein